MAASTRVLPKMDISIDEALREQLTITIGSKESLPILPEISVQFNSVLRRAFEKQCFCVFGELARQYGSTKS